MAGGEPAHCRAAVLEEGRLGSLSRPPRAASPGAGLQAGVVAPWAGRTWELRTWELRTWGTPLCSIPTRAPRCCKGIPFAAHFAGARRVLAHTDIAQLSRR